MRIPIRGINTVYKTLADGTRKPYYYHRATGKRLDGVPNSPEFIAAYSNAEKAISRSPTDNFSGLIRRYTFSAEFRENLAPATQTEYRRMLTTAEAEFGTMPIKVLDDPGVRKEFLDWREQIAGSSGKREADNRLSAISAMLSWAVDRGEIAANHLRGFKRLYHADRSEIIWLPEHIAAFMKVASVEMQRALILASAHRSAPRRYLEPLLVCLRRSTNNTAPTQAATRWKAETANCDPVYGNAAQNA